MTDLASGGRSTHERRNWSKLSIAIAGAALFITLGGSAVAANGLIRSNEIAKGAVTSRGIQNGAVNPWDLNPAAREYLQGAKGQAGATAREAPPAPRARAGSPAPPEPPARPEPRARRSTA